MRRSPNEAQSLFNLGVEKRTFRDVIFDRLQSGLIATLLFGGVGCADAANTSNGATSGQPESVATVQQAQQSQVVLPSYTGRAAFPDAGTPGNVANLTNYTRGIWMDNGKNQWVGQNGEIANVRDFGALGTWPSSGSGTCPLGADGGPTTGDEVFINAAIASINPGGYGGIVYFPPGTYAIAGPIIVPNANGAPTPWGATRLIGASRGTVLRQCYDRNTQDSQSDAVIQFYGSHGGVENMTIECDSTAGNYSTALRIAPPDSCEPSGCSSLAIAYNRFSNLLISNCNQAAVYMLSGGGSQGQVFYNEFDHIQAFNNSVGVWLAGAYPGSGATQPSWNQFRSIHAESPSGAAASPNGIQISGGVSNTFEGPSFMNLTTGISIAGTDGGASAATLVRFSHPGRRIR